MDNEEFEKELKFGTKEDIIDTLSKLKDRIDSAISYMNYKGTKGNLKNHFHDLEEIQFWSEQAIKEYIHFIENNFIP